MVYFGLYFSARQTLQYTACTNLCKMCGCVLFIKKSYCCEVMGKYFINLLDICNDINLASINLHSLAAVFE